MLVVWCQGVPGDSVRSGGQARIYQNKIRYYVFCCFYLMLLFFIGFIEFLLFYSIYIRFLWLALGNACCMLSRSYKIFCSQRNAGPDLSKTHLNIGCFLFYLILCCYVIYLIFFSFIRFTLDSYERNEEVLVCWCQGVPGDAAPILQFKLSEKY